jgi:LPS export ABC transporter protein LptC
MELSINYFIFTILLISILFIYIFSPKSEVGLINSSDFNDIVFNDFNLSRLTQNGLKMQLKSDVVQKMKKEYKLFNVKLNMKNDNKELEKITSDEVIIKESNYIKLVSNVKYEKIDNIQIIGEDMLYDIKTQKLSSKKNFKLLSKNIAMRGKGFVYYNKLEKFKSKNIRATLKRSL